MSASFLRQNANQRHATVLICVLACMAVVTALVTSTAQMALQTRKSMRLQHQLRQVEQLLEAGIDRAAQRLANDPEYTGEIWKLLPTTFSGGEEATVTIEVSADGETWPPEVTVVAAMGSAETIHTQRSHTFPLNISLSPLGD